ncbi:MAG: response regulator [Gammaproteobacteria bacterium]|jgi:RNA polymerase sigma factor (sigma-70 family)|nr:response regulator [Gammaproteobacteria bacterium]
MVEQSIFVVDDDEAVRDSIKELVESVGLHAQTFESAQAFLDVYSADAAGCLVLDVRMSHMSGPALQTRLKAQGCSLPIIFITGHGDIDTAVEAMKAGAVDFVQKPYHEQNLLDCINKALELDAQNRDADRKQQSLEEHLAKLTEREHEVMDLLVQGLANKAIAQRLSISPRTVEVHRQHVLEKCSVKSLAQLVSLFNHTADDTPLR